jgi:hypothetical protein
MAMNSVTAFSKSSLVMSTYITLKVCYKCITSILQVLYKYVTNMSQVCYKCVTSVIGNVYLLERGVSHVDELLL